MDEGGDLLLQRAVAGDEVAFDSLVGPLVEPGYRLALTMLGNPAEAEDAIQEATIKAWRNLGTLRPGSTVRPWFMTIVANHCRSQRRSRWWSVLRMDAPERPQPGFEEATVRRADVSRALARLDPDDRLVLHLRYLMDMSIEDVGRVVGISPEAAKSRIHRAAARMRPMLSEFRR